MMEDNKRNVKQSFLKPKHTKNEQIDALGKVPPQAIELEEAVLGALLLERDALTVVNDILKPESFYKEANQKVFRAVLELFDKSEPIDLLTVTSYLRQKGELEIVGGAYYISQLSTKVNSAANIEYHARIVSEQAIKRELISVASEIHKDAFEDTTDVFELLDRAEKHLYQVSESNIRKNYAGMRDLMKQALEELDEKRKQTSGLTGVPSGIEDLDKMTSGWQKSDLVIIAARPGMGKTAFVLSCLRNAAVDFNRPVAIFSLEMSSVQLVNRLISSEAEIASEKLKKGKLEDYEWQQLHTKITKLSEAPIYIDDTPAISIRELRTKCRRLKQRADIQMVIIDYLQLMSADTNAKGPGNREQEISAISRALKQLAKELNVPVLALSQLSRSVETRGGDKRPQLSDLRESGAIEQDADMVMFLYRPEYYKILQDEEGNSTKDMGEAIIAKHRNGSLDTIKMKFIGQFTKFTNINDFSGDFGGTFSSSFDDDSPRLGSKMNDIPNSFDSGFGKFDDDDKAPF